MIQLSILIPSIPSRWERAQKLYTKISAMCAGKDIEICNEVFKKNTHGPIFILCKQIVQNGFSLSSKRVE